MYLAPGRLLSRAGLPAPSLGLDFRAGAMPGGLTFTRASTAWAYNSSGVLTSFATDAPRLDHDPASRLPRGLLVEEARTNLLLRSAEFDNASWAKNGTATVTANATTAPDGTVTADTLNLPAGLDRVGQSVAVTGGTAYTFSCWLSGSGTVNLTLNSSGGTFTTATAQVTLTATLTRYSLTMTMHATNTAVFGIIGRYDGVGAAGTATAVTAWGAQLEAGTFATSYVPTVASTATRAADSCSASVANGTYDILVQDRNGAEWRNSVAVSGNSYPLTTRTGQLYISRLRVFPAGLVLTGTKNIMQVAA